MQRKYTGAQRIAMVRDLVNNALRTGYPDLLTLAYTKVKELGTHTDLLETISSRLRDAGYVLTEGCWWNAQTGKCERPLVWEKPPSPRKLFKRELRRENYARHPEQRPDRALPLKYRLRHRKEEVEKSSS